MILQVILGKRRNKSVRVVRKYLRKNFRRLKLEKPRVGCRVHLFSFSCQRFIVLFLFKARINSFHGLESENIFHV